MARTIDLLASSTACQKRHDTERTPYVSGIVKRSGYGCGGLVKRSKGSPQVLDGRVLFARPWPVPYEFSSVTESGKGKNCSRLIQLESEL